MQKLASSWAAFHVWAHPVLSSPFFWLALIGLAALAAALTGLLLALQARVQLRHGLRPYVTVSDWGADIPLPSTAAQQPLRLRLRLHNAGPVVATLGASRCRLLLDGQLAGEASPPTAAALLFPHGEFVWLIEMTAAQYPIPAVVAGTVRLGVELHLVYGPASQRHRQPFESKILTEFRPGMGWVTLSASAT